MQPPLPVEMTGTEGVVDRKLESSPSLSVGVQKKETLEINQQKCILLLRSNHKQAMIKKATQGTALWYGTTVGAVTNRLSEVSVTHDDTSHLAMVQVV